MIVSRSVVSPPAVDECFETRIHGEDQGLINAWLVGLKKRQDDPALANAAMAGELPPLPFRGGVARPIKGVKVGALQYLAAWQGLRGEDLLLDTDSEPTLSCSRTGVEVTFTLDLKKLFSSTGGDVDE